MRIAVPYDEKRAPYALIFRSELDFISRCILDCPRIETGGELFGYWMRDAVPVVLFALGPGQRANHQVTFFNQDLGYLRSAGRILVDRYGLQHIGEWHSHHQLGLASPSGHDAETMASSIANQDLGRFLMALGNCDGKRSVLNAFEFVGAFGLEYRHLPWKVKELMSPFRSAIESDAELRAILTEPKTRVASHGTLFTTRTECEMNPYPEGSWMRETSNHAVLKSVIDRLAADSDDGRCNACLTPSRTVMLMWKSSGVGMSIEFGDNFPSVPPILAVNGVVRVCAGVNWCPARNLAEAILTYLEECNV